MTFIDDQITNEVVAVLVLGFSGFAIAMALTPIYTYFAYKYKLWKKIRTETITGEKSKEFTKLHAEKHKRHLTNHGWNCNGSWQW